MVDFSVTDSTAILPELSLMTSALIARRVSAYYPDTFTAGESSRDFFILQEPRTINDNWTGNPPVAQLFQPSPGSGQSIFFSLPLHMCGENGNMFQIMDHIFLACFASFLLAVTYMSFTGDVKLM